jgi:hypothetical protein
MIAVFFYMIQAWKNLLVRIIKGKPVTLLILIKRKMRWRIRRSYRKKYQQYLNTLHIVKSNAKRIIRSNKIVKEAIWIQPILIADVIMN